MAIRTRNPLLGPPEVAAVPIRVSCPSCGRSGRVPDNAIGRTVQCPACTHRYRLTPELAVPEGLELVEDEPAPARPPATAPRIKPPSSAPARPKRRPAAHADPYDANDPYSEGYVEPPQWALKPRPPSDIGAAGSGSGVSLPVLIGGSAGAALLLLLATFGAFKLFSGSASEPTATVVATNAAPQPMIPVAAVAPAPVAASAADVAARAQATVAKVGTRDEGGGHTLSTADIVAESEPSVAIVKGKHGSGTGFLAAPGLLITNDHVVEDEFVSDLQIHFVSADAAHKGPIGAELLYEDRHRDLAFLAVQTDLRPLRVAKTYTLRKGEDITVIGSPGRGDDIDEVLPNAISRGVMSIKTQLEDKQDWLQLNVSINPGNSGGPVFDSSGRVIGVLTLKGRQEGVAYCSPVEDLQTHLAKMAAQSTEDGNRMRSRHRAVNTVMALTKVGALICMVVDLRRISASASPARQKAIAECEKFARELDQAVTPSIRSQTPLVASDTLIAPSLKRKLQEMIQRFDQIHQLYDTHQTGNDIQMVKHAYTQLITELSGSLNIEVDKFLLAVLSRTPEPEGQTTIVMIVPPSVGSYRPGVGGRYGFGPQLPQMPQMPQMPQPMMPQMPNFPRPFGPRFGFPG